MLDEQQERRAKRYCNEIEKEKEKDNERGYSEVLTFYMANPATPSVLQRVPIQRKSIMLARQRMREEVNKPTRQRHLRQKTVNMRTDNINTQSPVRRRRGNTGRTLYEAWSAHKYREQQDGQQRRDSNN